MEEDDDVAGAARRAHPLVFETELAAVPVDAGEGRLRLLGPVGCGARLARRAAHGAGSARSRSRSRKRWILPVAVFGSSATNSIARGYL